MTFEGTGAKTRISQERKLKSKFFSSSIHSNIFECLPCAAPWERCWKSRAEADVQSLISWGQRVIAPRGEGAKGNTRGRAEARGACGRGSLPAEATLKLKVEDRRGASQVKRAMRGVWSEEGMAPEKLGWGQEEHGAFEDEKGVGDCSRLETEGRVTRGEAESNPAGPHKPR